MGALEMLSTREAELAGFPTQFMGKRVLFCVEWPWSGFLCHMLCLANTMLELFP